MIGADPCPPPNCPAGIHRVGRSPTKPYWTLAAHRIPSHLRPPPSHRTAQRSFNKARRTTQPKKRAASTSCAPPRTNVPPSPKVRFIAGMRRFALPAQASIPYQLRQTLLCHSPPFAAQPWLLASRHDRVRGLATSNGTVQGPTASEAERDDSSSNNSSSADDDSAQNHDRKPSQQAKDRTIPALSKLPYKFETGISLFAKRQPRPFPPPFLSPPSGSFSDPLSTHHRSRDRRPKVHGQLIKGWTNGDDAVFASEYFIGANDGVGAWSARPRGHAGYVSEHPIASPLPPLSLSLFSFFFCCLPLGRRWRFLLKVILFILCAGHEANKHFYFAASLWARLILHFWATAMSEDAGRLRAPDEQYLPDPIAYLQRAYEQTQEATGAPDWQGTTTATGAQLVYEVPATSGTGAEPGSVAPILYITNLGDSQVMVVRPSSKELVFKTTEQWHWFDCPRQLGTNSPDTPTQNAVLTKVPIKEGDVVLAMSDGVIDNLWSHEIVENVSASLKRWESGEVTALARWPDDTEDSGPMAFVAQELMLAAKVIALDPFAESPFMEHAIEEGLPSEGGECDRPRKTKKRHPTGNGLTRYSVGKLDDISVVAARCMRNDD